jgi:hypothetical protein
MQNAISVEKSINSNSVRSELKVQWAAKIDELNFVLSAIHDIDARLKSWSLNTLEAIGLGTDDVNEDQHLYILPNDKLSKNDLQRKKCLLQDKELELEAEIKGVQAVIRQLEMDAKAEETIKNAKIQQQKKLEYVAQYNTNPAMYFTSNLLALPTLGSQSKEDIYSHADKIIAITECINNDTPKDQLWPAWKLLAKARDLAFQDQKSMREKYGIGARRFFMTLISILPAGLQGVKFLYDARDFDRADYYLNEAFMSAIADDQSEFMNLLSDLADEVEIASKNIVKSVFAEIPRFNRLAKNVKNGLVEQQAYVNRLRYDISYAGSGVDKNTVAKLKQLSDTLEKNIVEVIKND